MNTENETLNFRGMENRNQDFDKERNSSQNPMTNSSDKITEQNASNPSHPGGDWPKDETMQEYLRKQRGKDRMRPGSLDR
jgi:hypothetical protein